MEEPNQVWCIDFQGWFRTQDGERCDPLTMSDGASRYLLRCQALRHQTDTFHPQPNRTSYTAFHRSQLT